MWNVVNLSVSDMFSNRLTIFFFVVVAIFWTQMPFTNCSLYVASILLFYITKNLYFLYYNFTIQRKHTECVKSVSSSSVTGNLLHVMWRLSTVSLHSLEFWKPIKIPTWSMFEIRGSLLLIHLCLTMFVRFRVSQALHFGEMLMWKLCEDVYRN